ncbi:MAG: hypothetical protein KJ077_10445 [Anaerolineae bacterium]|nr:hypothetical protein [Anaerolineae bacterium]
MLNELRGGDYLGPIEMSLGSTKTGREAKKQFRQAEKDWIAQDGSRIGKLMQAYIDGEGDFSEVVDHFYSFLTKNEKKYPMTNPEKWE